jgi:hypothetical protein
MTKGIKGISITFSIDNLFFYLIRTLGIPFDTPCRCNEKMDEKCTILSMLFHTTSILIDNAYSQILQKVK